MLNRFTEGNTCSLISKPRPAVGFHANIDGVLPVNKGHYILKAWLVPTSGYSACAQSFNTGRCSSASWRDIHCSLTPISEGWEI